MPDDAPTGRLRRALRAVALDLDLLRRRRDFRLLVLSRTVSMAGTMVTFVAIPFQVYDLTGSSLAVGLLGVAEIVPILALALLGGALADAFDRGRLVRGSEAASALLAAALLVNALLPDPQLWVLFACAAGMAGLDAIRRPPMDALVPRLVERDELKAAAAVDFLTGDVAMVGGPALGGVLIATAGLPVAYGVDIASYALALVGLLLLRTPPPEPDAEPPSVKGIVEGVRYAASRQELIGTYLVDMNAMFFGMPMALFPAIAAGYGGAEVLGLLYAAPAVGTIAITLTSGWTRHVHRHGRAVAFGAAAWGAAMIVFGLADALWLALLALAVAGGMDGISGIFRNTMWNETIPDRLRGRLAGIEMISWSSGPTLGNAEAGVVAALAGVRASVISGGVLCIAGTVALVAALPGFWRYDARHGAEGPPPRPGRPDPAPVP